jgi:hypothetical protein
VFSHGGGTVPFLASPASAFSDPVLHLLRSVTGLHNVVFGTDYPYPRNDISIGGLRTLRRTTELADEEGDAILGDVGHGERLRRSESRELDAEARSCRRPSRSARRS